MPKRKYPPDASIYERLLGYMADREMTQSALGQHLGLSRGVISRAFQRRSGLEYHWVKIAGILDISLDWLLAGQAWAAPAERIGVLGQSGGEVNHVALSVVGPVKWGEKSPKWTPASESPRDGIFVGRCAVRLDEELQLKLHPGSLFIFDGHSMGPEPDDRDELRTGDFVIAYDSGLTSYMGFAFIDQTRDFLVIHHPSKRDQIIVLPMKDLKRVFIARLVSPAPPP